MPEQHGYTSRRWPVATLANAKRGALLITKCCRCQHTGRILLAALRDKWPAETPIAVLAAKLRCTGCRIKNWSAGGQHPISWRVENPAEPPAPPHREKLLS